MDNQPMANTDKELWSTVEGDYYSKHKLYLTERGGLTLCEGGTCITLPPEDWFRLANQRYSNKQSELVSPPRCHYCEFPLLQSENGKLFCDCVRARRARKR